MIHGIPDFVTLAPVDYVDSWTTPQPHAKTEGPYCVYLRDVWLALRRRWYVGVVAAVFVVLGGVGAGLLVGPTYVATAEVVLVPPRSVEDPSANRFLGLGDMDGSVDVLARSMFSVATASDLRAAAPEATYEVTGDPTTSAPIVVVSAASSNSAAAKAMMLAALRRLPMNLRALQAEIGIKKSQRITIRVVTQDPQPVASQKTRVRVVAALTAALLFLSAVVVAAVDGMLLRRVAQREAAGSEPEAGSPQRAAAGKSDQQPGRAAGSRPQKAKRSTPPAAVDEVAARGRRSGGRRRG